MGNKNCFSQKNSIQESYNNQGIIQDDLIKANLNFTNPDTFIQIQSAAKKFCLEQGLSENFAPIVARLIAYRHDGILQAFRKLINIEQKKQFLGNFFSIDVDFIDSLYHNLIISPKPMQNMQNLLKPPKVLEKSKIKTSKANELIKLGNQLIRENKVSIVIMCAGSSTRFFNQDKFLCKLDIPSGQCILDLMFQKLKENIVEAGCTKPQTPIIIMINEDNRKIVQKYVKSKNFYGFDAHKIMFAQIGKLPILDENGKLCVNFQHKILAKPQGTGCCAQTILSQAIYSNLISNGVKYVHFIGVQNPKENPIDPLSLGLMQKKKLDCCAKCTSPNFATENFLRYAEANKIFRLINNKNIRNQKLLAQAPIAMNSIFLNLDAIKELIKDYNVNMFLANQYRVVNFKTDYFDFVIQKPQVNRQAFYFQKEICDIVTCCKNPVLLKCERNQFLPFIETKGEFGLGQLSLKLKQDNKNSLSTSNLSV